MLILRAKNMYKDWKLNCTYGLASLSYLKNCIVIFKLRFLLLITFFCLKFILNFKIFPPTTVIHLQPKHQHYKIFPKIAVDVLNIIYA